MAQFEAACVAIFGFTAIVAGATLLGGTPVGLIVFGVLTVASAALLYDPKAKRRKTGKKQQGQQPWAARNLGSR